MADSDALAALTRDLGELFGARLRGCVSHGTRDRAEKTPLPTLVLVDRLTVDDLRKCAERAHTWHKAGLATPLFITEGEFRRSLDAFPFEFGAILDDYTVVAGHDPFQGIAVEPSDLRRACEVQARSHLLHLREAFIETRGRGDAVSALIVRSAAPLAGLLHNIGRLNGGLPADASLARVAQLRSGGTLSASDALLFFPDYLHALEQLVGVVDQWTHA